MNFERFLSENTKRVNQALLQYLPATKTAPKKLHAAMHYAVFNGGKRLRPLLVYAVGKTFGAPLPILDVVACAVEFIHTFSLIHDDLPCIDNDDFRRGKPSCHKVFDEATALLAGDALQLLAIEILCDCKNKKLAANTKNQMIKVLTKHCGSLGLIGGEFMDIELARQQQLQQPKSLTAISKNIKQIEEIYLLKTSALIQASVKMGALAATKNEKLLNILDQYAKCIGLAFQIQDDVLELEEIEKTKHTKKNDKNDENNKKKNRSKNSSGSANTDYQQAYPMLIGIDQAKNKIAKLYQQAEQALLTLAEIKIRNVNGCTSYIDVNLLMALTNYIMQRNH